MINLSTAIVDDEKAALSIITRALKQAFLDFNINLNVEEFSSLKNIEFVLEDKNYDLMILDIDTNEKENGIEFAKKVRQKNNCTNFIFVSNCEDKAFDAFEVEPLGFIRKKNFINDLNKYVPQMAKMLEKKINKKTILLFNDNNELINVKIDEITYVEGNFKQQYFYTKNPNVYFHTRKTMKTIEDELSEYGFIRTHNSYLVNASYINGLLKNELIVYPDIKIPIARTKISVVKKECLNMLKNNNLLF